MENIPSALQNNNIFSVNLNNVFYYTEPLYIGIVR